MLVFSRRRGEAIVVGDGIEIVFLSAGREGVRIGVKAPITVPVHRKEIYDQICEENRQAAIALVSSDSEIPEESQEGAQAAQPADRNPIRGSLFPRAGRCCKRGDS
jgi:carbon storage regulator